MYVSQLFIEGFRSLRSANINGMAPVTIFHGLNNSGKSNVLAALETIFASKVQLDTTVVSGRDQRTTRRLSSFHQGRIEGFRDNFYLNSVRKLHFKLSVVFSDDELKPHADILAQVPSMSPDAQKRITLGDGHPKVCNLAGEITYAGETVAEMTTREVDLNTDYPIYKKGDDGKFAFLPTTKIEQSKAQAFVDSLLGQLSDCFRLIPANRYLFTEALPSGKGQDATLNPGSFKRWLFNAYLARSNFHRFEEIQRIFNSSPFEYGELGFSHDANELEIMVKKHGLRLPVNRMGSGLQQILYLIAVIVLHKTKILAIEELEINLSPTAQKQVFEMLKKCVREQPALLNQVLVTSHSDYFDARDDVKCFSVVYDEQGACTQVSPWTVEWRKKHFYRES